MDEARMNATRGPVTGLNILFGKVWLVGPARRQAHHDRGRHSFWRGLGDLQTGEHLVANRRVEPRITRGGCEARSRNATGAVRPNSNIHPDGGIPRLRIAAERIEDPL